MKVMIVGLGSMGCRRARILRKWGDIQCVGVDTSQERRRRAKERFHMETAASIEEAIGNSEGISAALVCTPPLSHAAIIRICLERGLHVFTEINLVSDGYEENMKLAARMGRILFLSSTFLYREEINYIKKEVQKCPRADYIYHVGQYLPDWHPWEDFNSFFVREKASNGCRELFAIELPWLQYVFGKVSVVQAYKGNLTKLPLGYPDAYHVIIQHEDGATGSLQVDIVSRKAVRSLEIYGEQIYISWNGSPFGLKQYDIREKKEMDIALYQKTEHMDGYNESIIEDAYQAELQAFLWEIEGRKMAKYGFKEDILTLQAIDRIEGGA